MRVVSAIEVVGAMFILCFLKSYFFEIEIILEINLEIRHLYETTLMGISKVKFVMILWFFFYCV